MKNRIFLFILCSFVLQGLAAQEKESVRFGIRTGLNLSNMDFSRGSPPPETPIGTNWEPGLVAGFVVIIPLIPNLYFQPEYLFSQMGGEIGALDTSYRFNYLSLPVLIRWEYKNFYLTGGSQFALLINARKNVNGIQSSGTYEVEERNIGIIGGIGYHFQNFLGLEIRYLRGLNHVGLQMESGFQEFKYEVLQISLLVYLF